ncbi:hypothetical protein DFQ29_007537 [Apophysomyces sp. BC1021]|nr:hypothetical protein DFQ29_007537 [Apophysomyces sp. BC1021]
MTRSKGRTTDNLAKAKDSLRVRDNRRKGTTAKRTDRQVPSASLEVSARKRTIMAKKRRAMTDSSTVHSVVESIEDFQQHGLSQPVLYLVRLAGSNQPVWVTERAINPPELLVAFHQRVQADSGYSINPADPIETPGSRPSRMSKTRAAFRLKEIREEVEEPGEIVQKISPKRKSESDLPQRVATPRKKRTRREEERIRAVTAARQERKIERAGMTVQEIPPTEDPSDCCLRCSIRLYREAVENNDVDALKKVVAAKETIPHWDSEDREIFGDTLYKTAVLKGNMELVDILMKDVKSDRLGVPSRYMDYHSNTGFVHRRTFGFAVRKVNESRGNRQGDSAFYRSPVRDLMDVDGARFNLNENDTAIVRCFQHSDEMRREDILGCLDKAAFNNYTQNEAIYLAVASGNGIFAAKHLEQHWPNTWYNHLHIGALTFTDDKPFNPYRRNQIMKRLVNGKGLTPVSCAAINPSSKYLDELYSALDAAERNETDDLGRNIAHFAAASQTPECLNYLISKTFNFSLGDKYKVTPLMQAARFGRHHNIKPLLMYLNNDVLPATEMADHTLFRNKRRPLHYAAYYGHPETCRVLVECGATINAVDVGERATPLMLAAQQGHLACVQALIGLGADPEAMDRYERTPLHLATRNGHYAVVKYLLQEGVDANAPDSSSNRPMHYAAAFGWMTIVKLLVDYGGADPSAANVWRSTPCSVANLKGHIAIVQHLLSLPDDVIDVNFKDQQGKTMLHHCVAEQVQSNIEVEQILRKARILFSKNANVNCKTIDGETVMHALARANFFRGHRPKGWVSSDDRYRHVKPLALDDEEGIKFQLELANMIIGAGADLDAKNLAGETPLAVAMSTRNSPLVETLIRHGAKYWTDEDQNGNTFFHHFLGLARKVDWPLSHSECNNTRRERYLAELQHIWDAVLAANPPMDILRGMSEKRNNEGKTPLTYTLRLSINKQQLYFAMKKDKVKQKIRQGKNYHQFGSTDTSETTRRETVVFDLTFDNWCLFTKRMVELCKPDVNAINHLPKDFSKNNPKAKPSDYPPETGYNILHIAAPLQRPKLVEFLLDIGCDPNRCVGLGAAENMDNTPLLMTLSSKTETREEYLPDKSQQTKEYCDKIYHVIEPDYKALFLETVRKYIAYGASACSPGKDGLTPLMKAAKILDGDMASILCQDKNITANTLDNSPRTALMYAVEAVENRLSEGKCEHIDLSTIVHLLSVGESANVQYKDGNTVFMRAIKLGYFPLFRELLSSSIDHLVRNKDMESPLLIACKKNVPEIVQTYIEHVESEQIDVNICDQQHNTPLSVAAMYGNQDAVKILLRCGALPDLESSTSLIKAVRRKHYEIAKMILQAGADVDRKDDEQLAPLHHAVNTDKHQLVQLLLESGADVHAINGKSQTALHLAIEKTKYQTNASLRTERLLLRYGADINAVDILGRTALHVAFTALNEIPNICKMTTVAKKFRAMVQEEALVKSRKQKVEDFVRKYGLGDAESDKWMEEYKQELVRKQEDEAEKRAKKSSVENNEKITLTDEEKATLKMYTAFKWEADSGSNDRKDPIDIIRFLSDYSQLRYDAVDHFGRTPLHYAACTGAFSCTTYLLNKGVDINAADADKNCALQLALWYKHVDYSVMLCNSGASTTNELVLPNGKSISTFRHSLSHSFMNMAYLVMEKDISVLASLQDALRTGKFHLADILLQSSDDTSLSGTLEPGNQNLWHIISNFVPFDREIWDEYLPEFTERLSNIKLEVRADAHKRTPVHYAAKNGQEMLLRHLLSQQNCPLNMADEDKIYELWYAVSANSTACVQVLLDAGVSVNQPEVSGKSSVVALAVSQNNEDMVKLLLKSGAFTDSDSQFGRSNSVLLACLKDNPNILQLLIQSGANINTPSAIVLPDKQKTDVYPFFAAAEAKGMKTFMLLVDNGADPDILCSYKDKKKLAKTLFTFTASQGDKKKLETLLQQTQVNLNLKDEGSPRSIFYMYFFDRREEKVLNETTYQTMLHSCRPLVNEVDAKTGMTPLEVAIREHDIMLVNRLLEIHADPTQKSCAVAKNKHLHIHQTNEPVNAVFHAVLLNDLAALKSLHQNSKYPIAWNDIDNQGRNVICRLVMGTDGYAHENVDMLHFLVSAMGSEFMKVVEMCDNKGLRAIEYAQMRSCQTLYNALVSLGAHLPLESMITDENRGNDIDIDRISLETVEQDADAERMILQLKEDAKKRPENESKDVVEVDRYSQLQDIGFVALDDNRKPLDIMLIKIDVKYSYVGMNMFYKLSVIYNKLLDLYVLWTRWGSIGSEGMHQKTPFLTKEDAVAEFKSIFKSKTGNIWEDRLTNFVSKPGRFELISVKDNKAVDIILKEYDFTKSIVPAQTPPNLRNTVRFFCNFSYLLKGFSNANMDLPVGQIPQSSIDKAYKIFEEIDSLKKDFERRSGQMGVAERHSALKQQELRRLNDIAYLNFSANVALATKYKAKEINPLDYAYRALGCQLTEITPDVAEFDMVSSYMTSTARDTGYEISYLFGVDRAGEKERFRPFENNTNRKLLWHGSCIGNFTGILKQGLRCKPGVASDNGAMYGNGIYFADMFSKSINYVYNTFEGVDSAFGLLLLCEVALGKECEMLHYDQTRYSPADGHMSVKGLGKHGPNPANTIIDTHGVQIPMGPSIEMQYDQSYIDGIRGSPWGTSLLNHHEYIVYDEAQVKIRYLVLVRNTNYCFLCRKHVGESSVQPLRDYKLNAYSDKNLNDYERQVIDAYLTQTNKTAKHVFDEDLGEFIRSKYYNEQWDTPIDLSPTSKVCYRCAHSVTTMILVKRMHNSSEKLPDAIHRRPRCEYGHECRIKSNLEHAKRYQHWQKKAIEPKKPAEDEMDADESEYEDEEAMDTGSSDNESGDDVSMDESED